MTQCSSTSQFDPSVCIGVEAYCLWTSFQRHKRIEWGSESDEERELCCHPTLSSSALLLSPLACPTKVDVTWVLKTQRQTMTMEMPTFGSTTCQQSYSEDIAFMFSIIYTTFLHHCYLKQAPNSQPPLPLRERKLFARGRREVYIAFCTNS